MITQRIIVVFSLILTIVDLSTLSLNVNSYTTDSNLQNHRQNVDVTSNGDVGVQKRDDKVFNIDPSVVTNSHRPQYYNNVQTKQEYANANRDTLDKIDIAKPNTHVEIEDNESFDETIDDVEDEEETVINNTSVDENDYKPSNHLKNKQNQIKMILVKLLEKNDQKRKFAEILPILKMLTPAQRLVMASLVTKQLMADSRSPSLNLAQVKAMFGNNANVTSDLMLPIMLDIANMFRDAKDHYKAEQLKMAPQAQLLRRSFSDDDDIESMIADHFQISYQPEKPISAEVPTAKTMKIAATIPSIIKSSNVQIGSNLKVGIGNEKNISEEYDADVDDDNYENDDSAEVIKGNVTVSKPEQLMVIYPTNLDNQTTDNFNSSFFDSNSNETFSEDLPVAEKLRALNRYIDRNGNLVVLPPRPAWNPEMLKSALGQGPVNRKALGEMLMAQRRRTQIPNRQTLLDMAKHKCELFTNSLCLDSIDYPVEAISASIRRNQGAVSALLADFPEISADSAIDGVSSIQEKKYTPEHYISNMNRREDGQMQGSASGFMCPSTVKYARPQKARATSGQWKFIVNTGEHTQTLRLEKCLRPRESCTYLTDNFKSKCVQVYNYHRLLTWDQQNGLHMDIFKVPTCCSCHIEGYSVAFPPHLSKPPETSSEHFPGEDLSQDSDINPFEEVQSSIRHSTHTNFPASSSLDTYSTLGETHNLIPGSTFHNPSFSDENPTFTDFKQFQFPNQFDSIGSSFNTDIFQHQGSSIRNVKKPLRTASNTVGLPSFLEPPSKPVVPIHNSFIKTPDFPTKNKPFGNPHFKRGVPGAQASSHPTPKRPSRRPMRKKNSNAAEDQLVGATSHEKPTIINTNSFEDINESADKYERTSTRSTPMPRRMTTPKTAVSSSKVTIKNVSPTTERYRVKYKSTTQRPIIVEQKESPLNRRVNYNYHPIIDFFEESSKKEGTAADRMDSGTVYLSAEDDWRPMANPIALPLQGSPPESSSA